MIGKGETGREEEDAGAFSHPSAAARRALRRGSMPRLETNACGGAEVVSHSNRFLLLPIAPDYVCIASLHVYTLRVQNLVE